LYVKLYKPDTTWPTLPSVGTTLRVRAVTRQVAAISPVYIQSHPVDIAKELYELIDIPVNTAAYNTVKDALGPNLMVTYRIPEPETMADFLEKSLFGPFGFAARINTAGEVEFFSTRVLNYSAPTYTIATADLVGDQPPTIYDLDEATVVTGFTLQQSVLISTTDFDSDDTDPTPDGIYATTQTLEYGSGDTSTFSTRVVSYNVPGMVTDADSFVPTFEEWSRGVTYEGFERFGRGAVNSEIEVLRTASAAAAQVGDFVYINASFYPNRNYRIGESSVGARVAQVVRREERPESVVFKLVDAGGYVQPATAATVSIAKSTSDPRRVAQFTITNAATLNSGNIGVAVEWATGASAPAAGKNGNLFTRYPVGQVPTGAVPLPGVKLGGNTVYVRVRSEVPGIFPSAWSGWQSVALDAWTAPTGVTVGTLTSQTAVVSWSLNTNTVDQVDVYVAPGSSAPSDWTPYRLNTLPEGTTSTLISELTASTAYIVGIAFRDSVARVAMTPVTATFTTASGTTGTAPTPIGLQVAPGIDDVTSPQGVFLVIYPAPGAAQTIIERATSSGGTFTEIAVIQADTTTYVDQLPKNGTTYYYRVKHRVPGQADSAASAEVSGTALGLNVFVIPAYSAPSLKAVTTPGASSYDIVVTWDGTIVYNLDGVSQSVSGWTSPRTVNVTRDTGTATKVAAFAVSKTGVTVSESVNVPPVAPSIPQITSAFFSNGFTPGDGGGSVDITWSVVNMPSGVTYNIDLVDVTGDPITDASASYTGVTSPYTASIALGDGAEATCVIQALVGGITIAAYSFRSAIPI
jgi:hypothetical protein